MEKDEGVDKGKSSKGKENKDDKFNKEMSRLEKEKEKRENKLKGKQDKETLKKQNKEKKLRDKEQRRLSTAVEGDAKLGTMNRLSALFKFNKMNNEEGGDAIEPQDNAPPPPLPPKPSLNSPVRTNVGARFEV